MKDAGVSLPEAVVALALLALLAALGLPSANGHLARRRLEINTQRLAQGLERARSQAERRGEACGLSLNSAGWQPAASDLLPACLSASDAETNALPRQSSSSKGGEPQLHHNFPALLRISRNGLVLDGGTAVLSARGTALRRCLVMSPPLGVVRLGRYQGDPAAGLNSSACLPDPSL